MGFPTGWDQIEKLIHFCKFMSILEHSGFSHPFFALSNSSTWDYWQRSVLISVKQWQKLPFSSQLKNRPVSIAQFSAASLGALGQFQHKNKWGFSVKIQHFLLMEMGRVSTLSSHLTHPACSNSLSNSCISWWNRSMLGTIGTALTTGSSQLTALLEAPILWCFFLYEQSSRQSFPLKSMSWVRVCSACKTSHTVSNKLSEYDQLSMTWRPVLMTWRYFSLCYNTTNP